MGPAAESPSETGDPGAVEVAHHVVTLAEGEDLPAPGAAIKGRFVGDEQMSSGWKVPENK
ncbi:hypothetical protein ADK58_09260 [Streptomyces sp. XY152]|nr:hypothetical protein ADK58_09260 [Streptomyces sp. XY152]